MVSIRAWYRLHTCIVQGLYGTLFVGCTLCRMHSLYGTRVVGTNGCMVHSLYGTLFVWYKGCMVQGLYGTPTCLFLYNAIMAGCSGGGVGGNIKVL